MNCFTCLASTNTQACEICKGFQHCKECLEAYHHGTFTCGVCGKVTCNSQRVDFTTGKWIERASFSEEADQKISLCSMCDFVQAGIVRLVRPPQDASAS